LPYHDEKYQSFLKLRQGQGNKGLTNMRNEELGSSVKLGQCHWWRIFLHELVFRIVVLMIRVSGIV